MEISGSRVAPAVPPLPLAREKEGGGGFPAGRLYALGSASTRARLVYRELANFIKISPSTPRAIVFEQTSLLTLPPPSLPPSGNRPINHLDSSGNSHCVLFVCVARKKRDSRESARRLPPARSRDKSKKRIINIFSKGEREREREVLIYVHVLERSNVLAVSLRSSFTGSIFPGRPRGVFSVTHE